MGMLAPLALLFALTIPVILLLWLLKRRRQEQMVSSTYLWHQVIRDVRANAPWQRLRYHLLLMLQVAAALMLALTLARPFLTGALAGRSHLILLLDASGSMRTAVGPDTETTRFERARGLAMNELNGLGSQDRATLVLAGRTPRALVSTATKAQASAALAAAQASNEVADWSQAFSLAASAGKGQTGARAVVFTDQKVDPASLDKLDIPARSVKVGEVVTNLSVRLAARPPDKGQLAAALGRVINHGRQQAEATLELLVDGKVVDERRVDVPPGGTAEVVWRDLPASARLLTARLANPDALAVDNSASSVLHSSSRSQVLLVSQGNLFLEQALKLRSDLELVRTTPQNYSPGPYSLYVFDRWLPATMPEGAVWLLAPPPENPFMALKEAGPVSALRPGPQSGPLMAYVPLEDVHIARARPLDVPAWANVMLESAEGALLAAGHHSGRPVALLSFDIHESDFPLRIGFPVMVQNLLGWLVPALPTTTRATAGEPVPLALDPRATAATVILPDEQQVAVAPPFPAPPWSNTTHPGVYSLVQKLPDGERVNQFVVEFPAAESDVDPVLSIPSATAGGATAGRPPGREIWPWVAAAALAILGLEWWVYIRGA